MSEPSREYTKVMAGVVVCNNCGAYGNNTNRVNHFPNCKQGESKRWENFYNQGEARP